MTTQELENVVEALEFRAYPNHPDGMPAWAATSNRQNCACRVWLFLLADNETVRLSVGDIFSDDHTVDLLETKHAALIIQFMHMLIVLK